VKVANLVTDICFLQLISGSIAMNGCSYKQNWSGTHVGLQFDLFIVVNKISEHVSMLCSRFKVKN